MNNTKRYLLMTTVFCLITTFFSAVGEAAFNNTGLGARSLGMGRAATALADDVETVYWNPAGLSRLKTGLTFSHANLYGLSGTNLDSFSVIQPNIFFGGVLGLLYLKEDGVILNDKAKKTNLEETSVGFSFGKEVVFKNEGFPFSLAIGSCLKLLKTEKIELKVEVKRGVALDFGLLCQPKEAPYLKDFRIGLAVRNLLKTKVGQVIPDRSFRVGFGSTLAEKKKLGPVNLDKILAAIEVNKEEGHSFKLHCGVETAINKKLLLRIGSDDKSLTSGLGYYFGQWRIDYGFASYSPGKTHYLTASVKY